MESISPIRRSSPKVLCWHSWKELCKHFWAGEESPSGSRMLPCCFPSFMPPPALFSSFLCPPSRAHHHMNVPGTLKGQHWGKRGGIMKWGIAVMCVHSELALGHKLFGHFFWHLHILPREKRNKHDLINIEFFTLHLKNACSNYLASLPLPQTESRSSTVFNNVAGAFYAVGWVTLACRRDGCCANRCLHQPWVNTEPCLGIILPQGDLLPPPLVSFPTHNVKYSGVAASLLCPPVSCSLIIPNAVPPQQRFPWCIFVLGF